MFGNGRNGRNGAEASAGAGDGAVIALAGVRKVYDTGAVKVEALRRVDLAIKPNEFVAIVGPSGQPARRGTRRARGAPAPAPP